MKVRNKTKGIKEQALQTQAALEVVVAAVEVNEEAVEVSEEDVEVSEEAEVAVVVEQKAIEIPTTSGT